MPAVNPRRMLLDALGAGAAAGLVAETLVLRMNPEVAQTLRGVVIGMPVWVTWGMLMAGVPLLMLLALLQWVRPRPERWTAPELFAGIFALAAVLSLVNAEFHAYLMPGSAYRTLFQDAVSWAIALLLAVGGGVLVRRFGSRRRHQIAYSFLILMLPILRVVWVPTPERQFLDVAARPLGPPSHRLLVIGLEGLDSKVLLADTAGSNLPTFTRLREEGGRAVLRPHRPYLRRALWTSAATGTYPGRHGVKADRAWSLPPVFPETIRLLPWTPQGSRLILPWGLARRVPLPPATVAPLWARLAAFGVETSVFGWPGSWGPDSSLHELRQAEAAAVLAPVMLESLDAALEPLPEERDEIWRAIARDQTRVEAAVSEMRGGGVNTWVYLEGLSAVRQIHEPLRSRHTRERRLVGQVIELVDDQLDELLAAAGDDTLVAIISPYGLEPPQSQERFRRLLGIGGTWNASAESCPDGLVVLLGPGVAAGARAPAARTPDVVPTACYLLGLPVAQYMEGSVIVDLVEPAFLADQPLRVVE